MPADAVPVERSGTPETGKAAPRPKVFISYSRRDIDFATALVADLDQRGFQPFLDRTDIAPGEPWRERLSGLIAAADTMVFVVSPASANSPVCEWEVAESGRLGKRIIPLVCRAVELDAIPPGLARLNFIFATTDAERPPGLDTLEASLRQDLAWVREHTRLAEIAFRWDKGGRTRSQTLRGSDLEAAERWLAHQPGDASQPTALHRDLVLSSRRAARTRQRAWVGGSLAVAAVALGLAVFAEISRRRADDALQAARGTANTLVTELASGLRDRFGMPATLVRSILQPALGLQERLLASAGPDAGLRMDESHALALMTVTLLRIGDTQEALKTAERSRGIVAAMLRRAPDDPRLRTQMLESLRGLALAANKAGHGADAKAALTQLAALAREGNARAELVEALTMLAQVSAPEEVREAMASLDEALPLARQATGPQAERALAELLVQRSVAQYRLGQPQAALITLNEAYKLAVKGAADDTDAAARRELARTLGAMGAVFYKLQAPEAMFASVDDSLRIYRELAWDKQSYEAQNALAGGLFAAAGLRSIGGRAQESIATYEECIEVYRALARDGTHLEARIHLADTLVILANTLVILGGASAGIPERANAAAAELAEAVSLYRADAASLSEESHSFFKQAESLLLKLRIPS